MAAVARMMRSYSEERASTLAREAIDLSEQGHLEQASRKLREAAALGHDNAEVQAAFLKLHKDQTISPLPSLCRRYAVYHDSKAGDEAADYLRASEHHLDGAEGVQCLKLLLESGCALLSPAQDVIISQLVRQSHEVRRYFATELQSSSTKVFDDFYERGDEAANCLRTVVLDATLWPSEEVRLSAEDDLFQLLLAKLMESGHDLDGRALRGLALLLMADVNRLSVFIDQESFDAILSSLDIRLPIDVRSQATIVASKYLEVSEGEGQTFFNSFVSTRIAKQKAEPLVVAFSAAIALFPVSPTMVAPLFLTDGFLQSLLPLLEKKLKTDEVYDAFLQLLNAACIDNACRLAIGRFCSAWLSHIVSNGEDGQPAAAATILAKLRLSKTDNSSDNQQESEDLARLVDLFKTKLSGESSDEAVDSVEGLAYASLKPEVKEELVQDIPFLKSLYQILDLNTHEPEVVIGGLSIISNLTQYLPNLSEEEKKMSELKAYANATKVPSVSNLEDDQHVNVRSSAVVNSGAVSTLVRLNKNSSSSVKGLIDGIILSLSRNPKNRATLAQQGAVKLLVSHATDKDSQSPDIAAHALARVLISVNPTLVFPASGTPHITAAVRPLVTLVKAVGSDETAHSTAQNFSHDQSRDLLPVFESLLALTNLASSPDGSAAELIIRTAWDAVEEQLLSNNTFLRRASCELVCNLMAHESGVAKYLDGSKRATQRLHVLLALADVEDVATRRAAGGALAMITEVPASITAVIEIKRGVEILLDLCQDENEEIVHRGLVCVRNLSCAPNPAGARVRKALTDQGAVENLTTCLKKIRDPPLLQIGVDALKPLIEK